MANRKFTYVDCFAGTGGICTWLHATGFETLGAIEYIKSCCEIYSTNPPNVHVLDVDFLKLPKFQEVVNGCGTNHIHNGWGCMYIFTNERTGGRFFQTNVDFEIFKQYEVEAARMWLTHRQWFNEDWKPTTTFEIN